MVSDETTLTQPPEIDRGPRDARYFTMSRVEIALCVALVSTCPVCGEEHSLPIPASETPGAVGADAILKQYNYPILCAGPVGATPPPVGYIYHPPTHGYTTRALRTTVQRAIERDTPRRLWWPFTQHDAER